MFHASKMNNQDSVDTFHHYFQDSYEVYSEVHKAVGQEIPQYTQPFPNLPFTSFTLNVDRQCICLPHVDGSNLSFGLCLICPFGKFNHRKGGHLVLHDLHLILELSPGSIAFIPSALIIHSNLGIGHGETRHAITAYTPANIFRWCLDGLQLSPNRSPEEQDRVGRMRWKYGKSLFPHITQFF